MKNKLLFSLGVAVLLAGCATRIAGLRHSPTFTYPSVISGKMAVGGVVSAVENLDEGRRSALAGVLRTALIEERKEYNILPVGSVMNRMGSQYAVLLSEMKSTGSLSDKSLQALKNKMPDARYVIFARVESDEVAHDRSESATTDKNGNVVEGTEKVTAKTDRAVSASLHVYDLKSGDVAWGGTVTKSASNSLNYSKEKELGLVSVIKAIKGDGSAGVDQQYPYPAAPDSAKILARVFAGFGENLPEKE